jgi:hypothetical protein
MKATITFLGSDDPEMKEAVWGEGDAAFTFPIDEPVEVDDEKETGKRQQVARHILTKAPGIKTFRVEIEPPEMNRDNLPKDDYSPVRPVDDDGDDAGDDNTKPQSAAAHSKPPAKKK